jgi:hypothetical protein
VDDREHVLRRDAHPRRLAVRRCRGSGLAAVGIDPLATLESLLEAGHDVTVDAVAGQGLLTLTIGAGEQSASTMVQIQDRVGAVGGTATLCAGLLRVEMPCAS